MKIRTCVHTHLRAHVHIPCLCSAFRSVDIEFFDFSLFPLGLNSYLSVNLWYWSANDDIWWLSFSCMLRFAFSLSWEILPQSLVNGHDLIFQFALFLTSCCHCYPLFPCLGYLFSPLALKLLFFLISVIQPWYAYVTFSLNLAALEFVDLCSWQVKSLHLHILLWYISVTFLQVFNFRQLQFYTFLFSCNYSCFIIWYYFTLLFSIIPSLFVFRKLK